MLDLRRIEQSFRSLFLSQSISSIASTHLTAKTKVSSKVCLRSGALSSKLLLLIPGDRGWRLPMGSATLSLSRNSWKTLKQFLHSESLVSIRCIFTFYFYFCSFCASIANSHSKVISTNSVPCHLTENRIHQSSDSFLKFQSHSTAKATLSVGQSTSFVSSDELGSLPLVPSIQKPARTFAPEREIFFVAPSSSHQSSSPLRVPRSPSGGLDFQSKNAPSLQGDLTHSEKKRIGHKRNYSDNSVHCRGPALPLFSQQTSIGELYAYTDSILIG